MRRHLHASPDRTANSRPFQPTIPVRILREILLVIPWLGNSTETARLCRLQALMVDFRSTPPNTRPATIAPHPPIRPSHPAGKPPHSHTASANRNSATLDSAQRSPTADHQPVALLFVLFSITYRFHAGFRAPSELAGNAPWQAVEKGW